MQWCPKEEEGRLFTIPSNMKTWNLPTHMQWPPKEKEDYSPYHQTWKHEICRLTCNGVQKRRKEDYSPYHQTWKHEIYRLTCNGVPTQHLQFSTPKKHKRYDEADPLLRHPKANCTHHTHHNIDQRRHQKRPEQHVTPYLWKRSSPSFTHSRTREQEMSCITSS